MKSDILCYNIALIETNFVTVVVITHNGRDGMVQMHNSMRAVRGSGANGGNYGNMMGSY